MKNNEVKMAMQDAGRELSRRFPGQAWSLFIWPADATQRAHYIANAPRSDCLRAMKDLTDAGLPGIPDKPDAT